MKPNRMLLTVALVLATYAWWLAPDLSRSPAVLWPSALAVGLAFLTRDLYLALFLGAYSGALLLHGGNPWTAFHDLLTHRLTTALTDPWNISVLVFTLMMGGFVEVLNHSGGMTALCNRLVGRSPSSRRAGLAAWGMGWFLFFDGLASSMLVGKTLRPVADRTGLSREKLAFIVDSTASPIAGLALLSTWVAYEMSVIREGLANTGGALAESVAPFSWLVLSLPFRFYNWFTLLLVFLVVWFMRDWGPMLRAEQASRGQPRVAPPPRTDPAQRPRVLLALIPLAVLILGVSGGLYVGGGGLDQPLTFGHLVEALGRADAAAVFVVATALASATALGLSVLMPMQADPGGPSAGGGTRAFLQGMQQMFLPALILVFAWLLNSVIKDLGTATYLVQFLGERLPAAWLPALVFLLASVVSFSTGTSWGTMAIVTPLVLPLAFSGTQGIAAAAANPVIAATIGAVLAGAVFGDHCSPISDTTIVSAFSSDCDVMAHVRTQLPYALTGGAIATLLGYLPAGYGVAPGWCLATGGLVCWILIRFAGRTADSR